MAEMVEHQATVETGLKMKIKRKNPTQKASSSSSSEPRCKASSASAHEDKNGNIKSRKARQENRGAEVVTDLPPPTTTQTEEATSVEETVSKEPPPEERPAKRKRNAKSIRQTRIQNGADYEVAKGNKSKLDSADGQSKSPQLSSPKDKPTKNGKICPPEKNSRKRAASVCPVTPVISGCETPKPKSLRNAAYDKDAAVVDEKNTEISRKSGYCGIKNDADDSSSPRKADSKNQSTHEVPGQTAQDLPEDPYEFVAKVEDVIQTPVKKFKSDKAEVTCTTVDPLQPSAGLAIGGGSVVGVGGHHDIATETCSVGVTTDPDCLGPCEPGTSVILEGIVWSESNNGILVVNVTWRGKTYVGTLMDTTKHHWASPRFREDSPVPELDWRSPKSSKRTSGTTPVVEVLEGRRLRKCRRNIPAANGCTSANTKGTTTNTLRQSPPPPQLESNSSRRRARMADSLEALSISSSCAMTPLKKARAATTETDELLLECTLLNCNKKFKHISGLHYHQSHAHRKSLADESKPPDGGKLPSPGGSLDAPLPADMVEGEDGTHEENENCGVVESSSTAKDLSTDVVVAQVIDEEATVAGCGAQSVCCSTDEPLSSDVTFLASSSIASSSCLSDTPATDTFASGPASDGKQQPKVKENHASPPPPRPLSKPVALEPLSESEQSSVSTVGLPPRPSSVRLAPQDAKSKDGGGKSSPPSDTTDKSHSAESKVSGSSPAPLVLPQKAQSSGSCHNKPLPSASDDKEGKSCVVSSTADHQLPSETPTTGPPSSSATSAVSSSSSSGFPVGLDSKSPNYSDISDSAELLTQSDHHGNGQQQQQQQQGKDGDAKKQPRPTIDSRQQRSKHETTTGVQSHSSSTSALHPSAPLSNGPTGTDPVRQQRTKESEPSSSAKETKECFSSANNSYTKPTTPEEKPTIGRPAYHVDLEADAQAKEHRMWLENLHHHHHHHQNSAMASSMAMASSAAAAAMNMMPYGYGLDQAAYHLQFLSQNPETRSHYERWLMEQSHYLQQQQQHHHHQQQRCFNKLMQAEVERGPPSDSKPVDMTSKGQIHPPVDSGPGLPPSYAGKQKPGVRPDGKPADGGKSLHSKTTLDGGDWMSTVKHRDSLPSSNGVVDSCGDMRKATSAPQPSGRNNTSKEKLDGTRPEQLHKGCKDPVLWERNERVAAMNSKSSSGVGGQETRSSPDHLGVASHLPPISKASNPVGNISPYPSGNPPSGLLKNFIQDSSSHHPTLIGYNGGGSGGGASFMDLSEANSISPNGKFLDLDSKQVVTGSNHRRSGDGQRHALDVLRYQSAMYHGKQQPTTAEHLGSNGPKHNRSTLSKDFHEEPGHHSTKDGKGSPSGHSSPLTLRHLHTHHHTHVVGAAYPIYGSYNGLMSPVPAIVPPGPPVIAPTYLPK